MQNQRKLTALPPAQPDDYQPALEAPNNPDFELAVLHLMFDVVESDRQVVFDNLLPADFFSEVRGNIFAAMKKLHEDKEPVELMTIQQKLRLMKKWGTAEGKVGMNDLLILPKPRGVVPSSLPYYMKQVKDLATRRYIISSIGALGSAAMELDKPIEDVMSFFSRMSKHIADKPSSRLVGDTAANLEHKHFEESRWSVNGLLAEGHTMMVAPPKLGKSYFALNTAIAVSTGGKALGRIDCEKGTVLYLSIDDTSERRMQKRLRQMLPQGNFPDNLHIYYRWETGDAALDELEKFLEKHPETCLIVIDTLEKIRPIRGKFDQGYSTDVSHISTITDFAVAHKVSIFSLHHSVKGKKDDIIEEGSGTLGMAGSVDNLMYLKGERGANSATLELLGRDFDDYKKYNLLKDKVYGLWQLQEELDCTQAVPVINPERKAILELLVENPAGLTPSEIAEALNKKPDAIRQLLSSMLKADQIEKISNGVYGATQAKEIWDA